MSSSRLLLDGLSAVYGMANLPTTVFGLSFPNPVGLAAGMDKSGAAAPAWAALGFGFAELGGVTWRAQPGNPEPRVFRAIRDEALVNRMGFNNAGAEALSKKLVDFRMRGLWPAHPVGINLGKSKITPLEKAAEDYANSFRVLRSVADFFVVNVSSPNTPNLRQLQDKGALEEILRALNVINSNGEHARKPLLVKVAPDLSFSALEQILELTGAGKFDGIVATNTTIERPISNDPQCQKAYAEIGGLSGAPLRARSTEVVRFLHKNSLGKIPIIGVGGIFTAADAWEKITAGASLVQIYTGLVYRGPSIAHEISRGLAELLSLHGLRSISQAVGIAG